MARPGTRYGWACAGALALTAAAWVQAQQATVAPAGTAPQAASTPAGVAAAPSAAPASSALAASGLHSPSKAPVGSKPAQKTVLKGIDPPYWNQLNPAQQAALQPLAGEWDKVEGLGKKKWLEIANHFSSLKPDEQQRVHERMRDWVKLTPEQRRVARENYARTKKIEPARKSAQWEQYQQLPEDQKIKLAADAANKKQLAVPPSAAQKGLKPLPPIRAGVILPPPMSKNKVWPVQTAGAPAATAAGAAPVAAGSASAPATVAPAAAVATAPAATSVASPATSPVATPAASNVK